jgi:protease IV
MTTMRVTLLLSLVFSRFVFAQAAGIASDDASRGVSLIPLASALTDEALSISLNPAGLHRSQGFNLWYAHEKSNTRGLDNDGVYGTASFGPLAAGLSFEWLRPVFDGLPQRAKTSLALSGGAETFSAGATFNWLFSGSFSSVLTADLGIQVRPFRALSVAIFGRNLNAPTLNGTLIPREWILGVGVRPFGERLSLGVDYLVRDEQSLADSRFQYTLQASVFRGVRVGVGLSHGLSGAVPVSFQASLGIDFEHVGYTQGVSVANEKINWQFAARVSSQAHRSVLAPPQVAVLSLGNLANANFSPLESLLGGSGEDRFVTMLRFLDDAAHDETLAGVILKMEGTQVGVAKAEELHTAILKLRQQGKKVFAWVLAANDADYLVMSACDRIYATTEAMLMVDGFKSNSLFFGKAAEQLGIHVDVARVGDYKNSPDQYTRSDMSKEQREATQAYLNTFSQVMNSRVEAARKISKADFQNALDEGLISSRRAAELKLIDGVMTPKQFDEMVAQEFAGASVKSDYSPKPFRETAWRSRRSIAVISVNGTIAGGKNTTSPLGGDLTAGAASFIQSLNDAANDDDVVAIVLRIDSPGGDGLASDLMYRAVLEAKKRKPVIASMGDVAASGGYYVAMGAHKIVASRSTITGSIGVFYVKPSARKLAEDLGVNQVSISTGKRAGINDLYDAWTDEQREAAQKWVNEFYDGFITEVAANRNMEKSAVDSIARGRVWSGEDALAHHLIDAFGGLEVALNFAREAAKVPNEILEIHPVSSQFGPLTNLTGLLSSRLTTKSPWPAWIEQLGSDALKAASGIEPGLRAQLEFGIQVE